MDMDHFAFRALLLDMETQLSYKQSYVIVNVERTGNHSWDATLSVYLFSPILFWFVKKIEMVYNMEFDLIWLWICFEIIFGFWF